MHTVIRAIANVAGWIAGLFRRADVHKDDDFELTNAPGFEINAPLKRSKCKLHIRSIGKAELQHNLSDHGRQLVDDDLGEYTEQIARGDG